MTTIITNNELAFQLEDLVKNFLSDKIELFLEEEIKNYIQFEKPKLILKRYEIRQITKYFYFTGSPR